MPTNGMTIDGLNTVSSLTAQDEVPVWDKEASGEPTRKITAQNMAKSVKSLASLPNTTEMNTAIAQSTASVSRFSYVPLNNLSANAKGYFRIPVPDDVKNKTLLATTIMLAHPTSSGGLQVSGGYVGGDYLYVNYYAPTAISASDADLIVMIAYV